MKKNQLVTLSVLLFAFVLFPGCRKEAVSETSTLSGEIQSEVRQSHDRYGNECRLVSNTSEFAEHSYTYNDRGLVEQWNISWLNGYVKTKYDENGHLAKARIYSGGALVNTVVFFYKGDRVVKETWFEGDSKVKADEVFYFYNEAGKVWKSKSLLQNYVSVYKYTPDGQNVNRWHFYVNGKLSYAQSFTYQPPYHKQPNSARRGIDYDFIAANGWFNNSKWYSASEKDVSYDENGENPVVLLDQNPNKTVMGANSNNYVTFANYFDALTKEYVHFKFGYENCNCDENVASAGQKTVVVNNKVHPLQFLRLGSSKSIKEQMIGLRKQYGR